MKFSAKKILAYASLGLCTTAIPAAGSTNLTVQAGYHVIYSYAGKSAPTGLMQLISEGVVGGVILFGSNVNDNVSTVMSAFQSAYKASPAYVGSPLLLLTDQEGGEVRRLPGGPDLTEFQIGSSADPSSAATTAGSQAYQALAAAGMNGNLAPVLDVYRKPGDFIDEFQRSYSNVSSVAGECGAAFVAEQQGLGAVATVKHFPGLGAAKAGQDTDAEPVTINLPLATLRAMDEAAYVKPLAAGAKMVMTSWALYPALDDTYPAGLSEKWIQGELRQRLGFSGVTISDAIEAGALQSFGSNATRAVLAAKSGLDLILAAAQDYTQGQAIVEALAIAVENGTLSASVWQASTQRVLALRAGLG